MNRALQTVTWYSKRIVEGMKSFSHACKARSDLGAFECGLECAAISTLLTDCPAYFPVALPSVTAGVDMGFDVFLDTWLAFPSVTADISLDKMQGKMNGLRYVKGNMKTRKSGRKKGGSRMVPVPGMTFFLGKNKIP